MNPERPFVAVIGGLRQLNPEKAAAARDVAKEVGAELAKAGFGLVVYFSDDDSLEPHVVTGYVAALNDQSGGSIHVRYAESQRGKVRFKEEKDRRDLFDYQLFPGDDWEMPFYRSLAAAEGVDALLLLGGHTSTLIAGQIAVARQLPVLAIDEFGGSAAKIWNQLAQATPGKTYSWGTRSSAAFVQDLRLECIAAAKRREEQQRREGLFAKIISSRERTMHAALAFAFLLAMMFFGMVYTPFIAAYPFIIFAGLISAGATGALVRAVTWNTGDNDSCTSLFLGGVAGFVVGLAYLIPQWVGAPGVLEAKASAVTATDKIQFASAVLVAVSAGVGFDTVFSRLQRQAQEVTITPPR
jgi:hypothetical protein